MVPIEKFEPAQTFLVIVSKRLLVGVTRIIVAAVSLAAKFYRVEDHQDAEAALGFFWIENGVNRRSRDLADVKEGYAQQLAAQINAKFEIRARNFRRIGREKIKQRVGHIVVETNAVLVEEFLFFFVYEGRTYDHIDIAVLCQDALLTTG